MRNYSEIFWILIFASGVRILFYWIYPDTIFPDAMAYRAIGEEIFSGKTISNDIYMPLYPILTFLSGGGGGQVVMDILFSTASVALIYWLSIELFNERAVALLAASASIFYPHFLFYAIMGLTEVLFTFLLLLSFLLFYREKIVAAIFFLVLSVLVKPSLDFLNPLLVALFVFFVLNGRNTQVAKNVATYFIVYVVLMTPWWIHQYQKYDTFVRLNLGDGVVLYSGNNPMNQSGGGIVGEDLNIDDFVSIKDPVEKNNAMKRAAVEYIVEHPQQFLSLSIEKFIRFWRLWPYTEHYQQWYTIAASLLSYGVILFLAIGFAIRSGIRYFKKLLPIYALFGYLTLVHMITIGSIRYRFPLEPFLIIFAAHFVVDLGCNSRWMQWIERRIFQPRDAS